jgi:O-antigen ligase
VLALFIGVVTWIGGYPLTGLWFGINQIRYLLIIFVGGTITYRYGFRYLLMLLMSVFSLHIIYAIVESILGKSLGLGYFGDVHAGAGPPLGSSSISAITFHSGLYPGGFFGTSRALLAVLCLIFPSALYWLYHNQRSLPAFFTVIGTLLLVNISQSDTGTVVLFISVVAVVATVTLYQHGIVQKLSVAQAFMISVAVGSISSAFAWNVLTSGIFSNTAVRVEQYRIAWKMFLDNPLLGIGGQNFAFLVEKLMLSGEITEVPGIHNTFLAYLAELGIIGFVIYTLVTAMVYWKLLSGYLSNWAAAAECGALAVGFVAFHIYSSFTLIYQRPPVMMIYWLLTGGVVVYITENNIS